MADIKKCSVPGRVDNVYEEHTVATAMQILDDDTGESQLEINRRIREGSSMEIKWLND